ncbi:MAG: prolyl oligopeptidase family serine peptidase, partial [Ekhidna sp.]|nr:prolyl oligopeptidase family serine peptidase [Ekhidna sp.]
MKKTIEVDGIERNYLLYVPKKLPTNAPLLMVFHGYSGTAKYAHSYFNMEKQAEENGFVLAYPEGTKDQGNMNFWQVGYKGHETLEVNDVSFVIQLAEYLQSAHSLNKAQTFIVGFSNGGDLCNKLICERPDFFTAAAPIISCMMKNMYDACQESAAVPVLMLNGTKDDITFWAGDMEDKQGYGPYHSTPSMVDFRIKQAEASLGSEETVSSPNEGDKTSITIKKYANESTGNKVWFYQVNGGGHG